MLNVVIFDIEVNWGSVFGTFWTLCICLCKNGVSRTLRSNFIAKFGYFG